VNDSRKETAPNSIRLRKDRLIVMNPLNRAASEKRDFAFELKFLVPEPVAESALDWVRKNLAPDPFAGDGDGYRVNSVYLDTPQFEVFHRVGSYGRCKYRVRRYGTESHVFLERKLKTRGQVGKRRTRVPDHEAELLNGSDADPGWVGFWFHRRLLARRVEPKCQIAYERIARVGEAPEGPIRMTLDRNLRAFPTSDWSVKDSGPWVPLLNDHCILEMKFRLSLPTLFAGMIRDLGISPQPVSKYRLGVQKFGWASEGVPPNDGVIVKVDGGFSKPGSEEARAASAEIQTDSKGRP
jgi:hypothetical protein